MLIGPAPLMAADCGQYKGGKLTTKGAVNSCDKARRIVRDYLKYRVPSIQGFTCNGGDRKVVCALDRKRVIWKK